MNKIKNEKKRREPFCFSAPADFVAHIKKIQARTGLSKSAVVLRMLHLKRR